MKDLKKLRELAGMTQAELARDAGIDRTRLCLAESGCARLSEHEVDAVRKITIDAMRKRQNEITKTLDSVAR